MEESLSERRMAENEAVFRGLNERVHADIDEVDRIAAEDGQEPISLDRDMPLFFYCECSDENCRKRIKLSPNTYEKIHKDRNAFTIVCGHEVKEIEEVISKTPEYCVAVKHKTPPPNPNSLNSTDVDNS